jgi:hypothetical protein
LGLDIFRITRAHPFSEVAQRGAIHTYNIQSIRLGHRFCFNQVAPKPLSQGLRSRRLSGHAKALLMVAVYWVNNGDRDMTMVAQYDGTASFREATQKVSRESGTMTVNDES